MPEVYSLDSSQRPDVCEHNVRRTNYPSIPQLYPSRCVGISQSHEWDYDMWCSTLLHLRSVPQQGMRRSGLQAINPRPSGHETRQPATGFMQPSRTTPCLPTPSGWAIRAGRTVRIFAPIAPAADHPVNVFHPKVPTSRGWWFESTIESVITRAHAFSPRRDGYT